MKEKIGELKIDENGFPYRMINGKKIGQIEETTEEKRKKNETINDYRASGMSLREWMKYKVAQWAER